MNATIPAATLVRRRKTTPYVVYRGPSMIDGSPIRGVLYRMFNRNGDNRKTGPMAQLMIAPDLETTYEAVKSGADRGVCGDCPHRPLLGGGCYVNTGRYLPRVWETSSAQPEDLLAATEALMESGRAVRLGAWGDPTALPYEVVYEVIGAARGHTGYTSQWRTCDPQFRGLLMASVSSPAERDQARAAGWFTFRIRASDAPRQKGEMVCPASAERDHRLTCAECLMCCGQSGARPRDVVIVAHGSKWKRDRVIRTLQQDDQEAHR